MLADPQLRAAVDCLIVEAAARARIASYGLE
jgi:hypothetical protein